MTEKLRPRVTRGDLLAALEDLLTAAELPADFVSRDWAARLQRARAVFTAATGQRVKRYAPAQRITR